MAQLLGRPDDRFVMVNMLVYKEAAEGEGFEGLSGVEAYGRYASGVTKAQNEIGSRMIWVGAVDRQVVGTSDPQFATVALLEYASPRGCFPQSERSVAGRPDHLRGLVIEHRGHVRNRPKKAGKRARPDTLAGVRPLPTPRHQMARQDRAAPLSRET